MRVVDYVADFLATHGITACFGVTGGGAMYINDALGHHGGLCLVYNHHEGASAMAAEAYARYTGRPAALFVTSGPGGTNALTGVLGAYLDSIPMLVLSGQVKRAQCTNLHPEYRLRQLGDQEFDITSAVSGMTKYAVTVSNPTDIAYHLERALRLATTGRQGPSWLDIPLDVQGASIEAAALRHDEEETKKAPPVPPSVAKGILARIESAARPCLLVGTGVRLGGAWEQLKRLTAQLQIPMLTAWNASDAVAFDDPLFAGMPGTVGTRAGNFALQRCDLLLSLGCRLNIRMVGHNAQEFAKNAYKIIVDIDENELKKPTVLPDMPVCADVADLIAALLALPYTPNPAHRAWTQWCHGLTRRYPATGEATKGPETGLVNPYLFLDTLFDFLTPCDNIICSNGSACVMTFQAAKIKEGQRMFTNSGCASMGYGLPAALGVALAAPTRRTVCIEGDGSIMMNLQELATVCYHAPNLKIIVLNNGGYHSIRQTQSNLFSPPFVGIDENSGLWFPDFSRVAEAFALPFYRVTDEESAVGTLTRALGEQGPCLIEVMANPAQPFAPKVSAKRLPDGSLASAALDDMAPHLPPVLLEALREEPLGDAPCAPPS